MKTNVFAAALGSACAFLFLTEPYSIGQALSGSSLNVSGTATMGVLNSGTATINLLTSGTASFTALDVIGIPDFQSNTLFFGTSGTTAALSLIYSDGTSGTNSSITLQSTNPSTAWNWQRLTSSGTAAPAMQLDASNRLILTGTDPANPTQLVLDPNGTVSLGGSNLITQSAADSRYVVNSGSGGATTLTNTTISGTATINGGLAVSGTATLNGSSLLTQTAANALYLSSGAGLSATNGNVGIGTNAPGAQLQVNVSSPTTIGQIIKGAASQTADLLQVQDNSGVPKFKLGSDYKLNLGVASGAASSAFGKVYFGTDVNNASSSAGALYLTPSDGGRLFFGDAANSLYAVNFKYVSNVESFPAVLAMQNKSTDGRSVSVVEAGWRRNEQQRSYTERVK